MKAQRGNKEYSIDDSQQEYYQDSGFDIVDDKGKIIAYGRGKTVPYGDFMTVLKENERLKAKVTELESKKGKAATQKAGE